MRSTRERVLSALLEVTADGWPGSVREVMRAAGLTSPGATHRHLHLLADEGLAEQHPRVRQGGWRATTAGREAA